MKHKTLYLYLKKEYVVGAHIESSDKYPTCIKKIQKNYVDEFSFDQGYLNAPRVLSSLIESLQLYSQAKQISVALEPPLIHEIFSSSAETQPYKDPSEQQTIHIHSDGIKSYFYHCDITYPQMLQYFLAAHRHQLMLTRLSSVWFSYYLCYKQIQGQAYRSVQLIEEIQQRGPSLLPYFSPEMVSRLCNVDDQVTSEINLQDKIVLTGLFFGQKENINE